MDKLEGLFAPPIDWLMSLIHLRAYFVVVLMSEVLTAMKLTVSVSTKMLTAATFSTLLRGVKCFEADFCKSGIPGNVLINLVIFESARILTLPHQFCLKLMQPSGRDMKG